MKKMLSVISIITMLFMLASCSGEVSSDYETISDENGVNNEDNSGKVNDIQEVELSMIHYWVEENPGAETLAFNNAVNAFLETHPEVNLNQEVLSHDNYEQKIKTLAAANEMPDIFVVKGSMIDTFRENEIIAPLNDDFDARPEWRDGYKEGAFSDFLRGDEIYGAPFKLDTTSLIYYNEDIFAEVGIDKFPETWDEFITVIGILKEAGYTPIALGNKGKWVAESCILSTLGDRFTGSDWFNSVKEQTGAKFTDPEFVNALAALQQLAEVGAFNEDMMSIDHNQQRTLYYNKEAAMFIEGAWAINSIETDAPEDIKDITGIAIIPSVEGGKGAAKAVSGGAGWAYQINPELEGVRRQAALDLVEALTNQDYAKDSIELNGYPASDPGDYDVSKLSPLKAKAEAVLEGALYTPIYDIQLSPAVIETMNSGLQELLTGATTPEELAAKIQAENE